MGKPVSYWERHLVNSKIFLQQISNLQQKLAMAQVLYFFHKTILMSQINEIKNLTMPVIHDHRGNLSFIEADRHIPFQIKRVYYLYDVPGGAERGGHAHLELEQFIVAMSGSFDVVLDDGYQKTRIHLNRSYSGIYVPKMIWRELDNFSSGSVCLVLASEYYKESDYIRDYDEYIKMNCNIKKAS